MKFVRWLGAFHKGAPLTEAAPWELSQVERQVAVEPLWRGQSCMPWVEIGLEIDHKTSRFVSGWMADAFTVSLEDGTLRSDKTAEGRGNLKRFRNLDRFLSIWSQDRPYSHGEAVFDGPIYKSVVVKKSATNDGKRRAKRLADTLHLPLKTL